MEADVRYQRDEVEQRHGSARRTEGDDDGREAHRRDAMRSGRGQSVGWARRELRRHLRCDRQPRRMSRPAAAQGVVVVIVVFSGHGVMQRIGGRGSADAKGRPALYMHTNITELVRPDGYSARSARSGSTVLARRAGKYAAASATAASPMVTPPSTSGSRGATSWSMEVINRTTASVAPTPTSRPASTGADARATVSETTRRWLAPNAMRMPISRVRCPTT